MVKSSFREGDSSKWNTYWICCYLPCEQKVNTVLHLHRNWLLRSWAGDITVFRVAVLANLLVEVLSTLVWESSWRNDWWQISGTEGWYANPCLQDVNHVVTQGWGLRDGDLARWCGWEGELLELGYDALGHVFIPLIPLPWEELWCVECSRAVDCFSKLADSVNIGLPILLLHKSESSIDETTSITNPHEHEVDGTNQAYDFSPG